MKDALQTITVTGGAGFIGSNLIRRLLAAGGYRVVNVDKLTYAGNLESLADVESNPNYEFRQLDIVDPDAVERLMADVAPAGIMHLAAESHVDRSIDGPGAFVQTNVVGTFNLLHSARNYWQTLKDDARSNFRFLHVSTDEVYGSLTNEDPGFHEATAYDPHSPYSASKAASDHLVRAWGDTFGLPILVTNCSNNYGPFQFPEKLIPVVVLRAIRGEAIPVYGKGQNIRDWLYVDDHARAIQAVFEQGRPGQTYNVGGDNELQNIELVRMLCDILDTERPIADNRALSAEQRNTMSNYADLIEFVTDRPGHDFRYAINASKISTELNWQPLEDPRTGFVKTVRWYLENESWWSRVLSGDYQLPRQGLGDES